MKVIYYSTALYASHGGGNQSILFLKEARKNKLVDSIIPFPKSGKSAVMTGSNWKLTMRKMLRKIGLLQVFFFYRRNKFYLKELEDTIHSENPDAILIQTDSSFLQVKYIKNRFPGIVVATVVNSSPFDEPFINIAAKPYFRNLERATLQVADCNFFVSERLRNKIMNTAKSDNRDFVVHNGVDTTIFRPLDRKGELRKMFGLGEDKFIIGYVGTIEIYKRIDLLLESFKVLLVNHPNSFLVIVGNGPDYEKSMAHSSILGITEFVKFTGWVSHNKIPELLNCFDIAIHHCANDYMSPLKIFEYMAVGLPVIGPDIPAVREVFKDEHHLLLTNGVPEDVTRKLDRLITDVNLRVQIALEGRRLVLSQYTWEINVDFILSRIKEKIAK